MMRTPVKASIAGRRPSAEGKDPHGGFYCGTEAPEYSFCSNVTTLNTNSVVLKLLFLF